MKGNIKCSFLCFNVWGDFNSPHPHPGINKWLSPSLVGSQKNWGGGTRMGGEQRPNKRREEKANAEEEKYSGLMSAGESIKRFTQKRMNHIPREKHES